MPDGVAHPRRRLLATALGGVLALGLSAAVWFFSRPVEEGVFVVRLAPDGAGPSPLRLELSGPSRELLGSWQFQDVPGPEVLAALRQKVPWTAMAAQASQRRPCLTLELHPSVSAAARDALLQFALSQCCPGWVDMAACPVRTLLLSP
jgi:hypothetical protein